MNFETDWAFTFSVSNGVFVFSRCYLLLSINYRCLLNGKKIQSKIADMNKPKLGENFCDLAARINEIAIEIFDYLKPQPSKFSNVRKSLIVVDKVCEKVLFCQFSHILPMHATGWPRIHNSPLSAENISRKQFNFRAFQLKIRIRRMCGRASRGGIVADDFFSISGSSTFNIIV